jgi:hypothetical protein
MNDLPIRQHRCSVSVVLHTPGPWWTADDAVLAMLDNGAVVEIALVNPLQELRTDPEYANARLIAAAPELLAAAEKALNYIANTEDDLDITLDSGDALRAAITKARGA